MSDSLRLPIPGFPDYEMNVKGDVFNRQTGYRLRPVYTGNNRGTATVSLCRDGRNHMRSVAKLHRELWEVGAHIQRSDQRRPLMEFPNYEIDLFGHVYNVKTGRMVRTQLGRETRLTPTVTLYRNNHAYNRSVRKLVEETFAIYEGRKRLPNFGQF